MYISIEQSIAKKLDLKEKGMYVAIKSFMNFTTWKAKVSYKRIGEECGSSKNTVMKYVKQLVKKGVILQKLIYDKVKKQYHTPEYYFIEEMALNNKAKSCPQVVQKQNESSAKVGKVLSKEEMIRGEKEIDIDSLKRELSKDYSKDIIDKAFKTFSKATKRGTPIKYIENYIRTLCSNLKTQYKLIESINTSDNSTTTNKHKKSPSDRNTRAKVKTKFHNFEQRTSNYSPEELKKMVLNRK